MSKEVEINQEQLAKKADLRSLKAKNSKVFLATRISKVFSAIIAFIPFALIFLMPDLGLPPAELISISHYTSDIEEGGDTTIDITDGLIKFFYVILTGTIYIKDKLLPRDQRQLISKEDKSIKLNKQINFATSLTLNIIRFIIKAAAISCVVTLFFKLGLLVSVAAGLAIAGPTLSLAAGAIGLLLATTSLLMAAQSLYQWNKKRSNWLSWQITLTDELDKKNKAMSVKRYLLELLDEEIKLLKTSASKNETQLNKLYQVKIKISNADYQAIDLFKITPQTLKLRHFITDIKHENSRCEIAINDAKFRMKYSAALIVIAGIILAAGILTLGVAAGFIPGGQIITGIVLGLFVTAGVSMLIAGIAKYRHDNKKRAAEKALEEAKLSHNRVKDNSLEKAVIADQKTIAPRADNNLINTPFKKSTTNEAPKNIYYSHETFFEKQHQHNRLIAVPTEHSFNLSHNSKTSYSLYTKIYKHILKRNPSNLNGSDDDTTSEGESTKPKF